MFKRVFPIIICLLVIFTLPAQGEKPKLYVYTYSSFVSYGPAEQIKRGFEQLYPAEVVFVAPSGTGEVFGRLVMEMETGKTPADVFIGLADTLLPKALKMKVFQPYNPELIPNLSCVDPSLLIDQTNHAIPLNYGYVTLVYNPEELGDIEPPASLEDLTHPRFAKKLITMDASSGPGQAFMLWTIAEFGEQNYLDFWRRLSPSLLAITGGWSTAYSMFENGEAPIVVSYATDKVVALVYGQEPKHEVLTPDGQGFRQIEVMGIVSGSDQAELAHAFLNYVLSDEVQYLIPTTNLMFPANSCTQPPEVFTENIVIPENIVSLPLNEVDANMEHWLRDWSKVISQ
jgi:thiamine transport system substrate-binding protein